ncbi:MAG TPA: hypothetical protein VHA35_23790 [Dongiaceae bacterium]|nr:hypothetical protein [Dongiaceae bacterium]
MRRALPALVGATLLAVGLASCGGSTAVRSMPCPQVKVISDASYLTKFAADSEDLTDTSYEAKIAVSNQLCHYVVEKDTGKTTIRTDLTVQIMASRGPKLTGDKADITYKVSVTGPGGSHVGDPKWTNSFGVTIPLPADKPTNAVADQPSVTIPLANKNENGDFYRIYVYLQLSEKELAYNRRNPQQ